MRFIVLRNPQPHIGRHRPVGKISGHDLFPLCEYLVGVPGGVYDDFEYAVEKIKRHVFVKQVAHRIDEILGRLFIVQRLVESFGQYMEGKAVGLGRHPHGLQARGHHFVIAVFTSGRYFGASHRGVPCLLGPFDFGCFHGQVLKLSVL